MLPSDLKSPGFIPNSIKLMQETYKAISYADIMAQRSPSSDTAARLREFFLDCAARCAAFEPTPTKKEKTK